MNRKTQRNRFLQSMEWAAAGVSLLLFITAGGLAFFAQMALGPDDLTTVLLMFYLASWSYAVGMVVLSLLLIRLVVKRLLAWANRRTMKEFFSAESPVRSRSCPRSDDGTQPNGVAA